MFLCHSALIITQLFIVTLFVAGQKLAVVPASDLNGNADSSWQACRFRATPAVSACSELNISRYIKESI